MNVQSIKLVLALALTISVAPMTAAQAQADTITVSGSASYRQRVAMPPEAQLNLRIESVVPPDTAAQLIAERTEPFTARQVPIAFELRVPRAAIDPRGVYTLRATITVGSELRFSGSRPITLPGPAADKVDLLLAPAAAAPAPAATVAAPAATAPAVNFALPATFAGVLPCADCVGIAHTLTLRADGLYRLRRTYLGKPGDPVAEVGRWSSDARGRLLTLGRDTTAQRFEVVDAQTLRQRDRSGQAIKTAASLDLRRTALVDAVTEPLRWRGEFVYLADAASFTDCASGLRWPVATAGDYLAAERSYTRLRSAPGAPLRVIVDGRLDVRPGMEGTAREHLVIDRFVGAEPGTTCNTPPAAPGSVTASLEDTYWKLIELDGHAIAMAPTQQREVRLTLTSRGSRAFGFSGCNQFTGTYEHDGERLRFKQFAGTLMACIPPFMVLETQFLKMLGTSTGHRIDGQRLTLTEGDQVRARFEAVYLR